MNRIGTLSEIVNLKMGQSPKGKDCNTDHMGMPLLNGPTEFTESHPLPVQFTTDPKRIASKGSLLFCVRGSTTGKMNWADQDYAIGRGIAGLKHRNSIVCQPYVRGVIEYYLPVLLNSATGSTFPNVSRSQLEQLLIQILSEDKQKRISDILACLDDKISLLRQQNATLEAMAQALFKSWFVDFDPVVDNALAAGRVLPEALAGKVARRQAVLDSGKYAGLPEGVRGLFPDSFVFSEELGRWVPEGWEDGTIGDLSIIKGGFAYKSKDFSDAGYPVIKIKNINEDNTVNTHDVAYIPSSIGDQRPDFWLEDGDLIMAMTGATVGKIGVVVKHSELPHLLNQRVARFDAPEKGSKHSSFLKCYFNSTAGREFIINTAEGSAQPNISGNGIASAPTVIASPSVLIKFEEILQGSTSSFIQNSKEIQTLTRLRDVLLPELISGRLRV